jgi:hypothetical protein
LVGRYKQQQGRLRQLRERLGAFLLRHLLRKSPVALGRVLAGR